MGGRRRVHPRPSHDTLHSALSGLSAESPDAIRRLAQEGYILGSPLSHLGPIPRMVAYQIPGGLCIVSTQIFHIGGKALVQPQVIPPGHCHQVAEPLQGTRESAEFQAITNSS